MKLYLSSFQNGNNPDELLALLGSSRKTAVITNADDYKDDKERSKSVDEEYERLQSIGLDAEELDLRVFFGKSDELKKVLESYDLIWVRGGNVFILRRAMRQSGADKILIDMIEDGKIVYGGYSAGIAVLTPTLRGIELVDNPEDVPKGYDREIIWNGFNIFRFAIAPHYKSDHPESEKINHYVDYLIDHHMPFIALRDGESIVIDGKYKKVVD